jgi:hypothetical protein
MSKRVKRETVDLTTPDEPSTPNGATPNHAAENERLQKEVAHKNEVRVSAGIWLTERSLLRTRGSWPRCKGGFVVVFVPSCSTNRLIYPVATSFVIRYPRPRLVDGADRSVLSTGLSKQSSVQHVENESLKNHLSPTSYPSTPRLAIDS